MPQITGKENGKISLGHGSIFRKQEALSHMLPGKREPGEISLEKKKKISIVCRKGNHKLKAAKASRKGSLTLEAALSLPIFLFAVGMVLYLFVMAQIQYIVGNALDQAVAENALLRDASEGKVKNRMKAAFYKNLVSQGCPLSSIELGVAGFFWKEAKVDETYIQAQVTYQVKFPFVYFGKQKVQFSNRCKMRRWTGRQEGDGTGKKTEWVYITPTDTVYHKSRSCTHLKLSVKAVSAATLKGSKKYGACGHCTKGKKKGMIVYITEEGNRYHYTVSCSGLKRTVYMIPREEAGSRPSCSRCGRK